MVGPPDVPTKFPACTTTRVKSAIVFSLMIDGSGSLSCRIFGIFLPVRIVRKEDAIPIKAQPAAAGKQPYGPGLEHIRATADRVSMGKGFVDNKENDMKKTLIITAAAMLVGSSGLSFAGSATKGASGSAPGTQMNNSTTTTSRGASEFAPGDRMKDSTTGRSKGASELTPGDTMNDLRKKK